MEIERKFLVREPPPDLRGCASDRIEQGYVALDGDAIEVRVRRRGGRATLTIKQGAGHVRLEEELTLGRARFERLWALTEGRRLEKVRHLVPVGDATVELDVYGGELAGLVVAEVEFAAGVPAGVGRGRVGRLAADRERPARREAMSRELSNADRCGTRRAGRAERARRRSSRASRPSPSRNR